MLTHAHIQMLVCTAVCHQYYEENFRAASQLGVEFKKKTQSQISVTLVLQLQPSCLK